MTKDRISEPEKRSIEFTQSEKQVKKKLKKKKEKNLRDTWDYNRRSKFISLPFQKEMRRNRRRLQEYLKK